MVRLELREEGNVGWGIFKAYFIAGGGMPVIATLVVLLSLLVEQVGGAEGGPQGRGTRVFLGDAWLEPEEVLPNTCNPRQVHPFRISLPQACA